LTTEECYKNKGRKLRVKKAKKQQRVDRNNKGKRERQKEMRREI
jgi:hypothetical protein